MNKLFSTILGKSPLTSILGYVAAAVIILQEQLESGITDWKTIAIAILVGVFGRVTADSNKVKPKGAPGDDGPGPGTEPPKPPVKP